MKRVKLVLCLVLPASLLGLFAPVAAPAATDYFLKLEGIQGESADDKHKNEIEVLSWSWGANQTGSSSRSGGSAAGKVVFQDFQFTKRIDKASPVLLTHVATGQRIRSAQLTVRKAGKEQLDYLKFCLTDATVASVQQSAATDPPMESFSLNFGSIVQTYVPQAADGRPLDPFVGGWDLVRNLALGRSACDRPIGTD